MVLWKNMFISHEADTIAACYTLHIAAQVITKLYDDLTNTIWDNICVLLQIFGKCP